MVLSRSPDRRCQGQSVLARTGVVYAQVAGGAARWLLGLSVLLVLSEVVERAHAAPETWFEPVQTVIGAPGSHFGAAIACSNHVYGVNQSYFAIGAPQGNSGSGQVHIIGPSGTLQIISSPNTSNFFFGAALTFIADLNADYIDELLIGEPSGSGGGSVHAYLSSAADPAVPYVLCGSQTGGSTASFGSFILPTSDMLASGVRIAVSSLGTAPAITAWDLTISGGTSCAFAAAGEYLLSNGPANSRFGQSLGELTVAGGVSAGLVVGAPRAQSNKGAVFYQSPSSPPDEIYPGNSTAQFGVAVASRPDQAIFAFNSPYVASGGATVQVKSHDLGGFSHHCSASIPMSDLSDTAGQSLITLGSVLNSFVDASTGFTFGSYRSEATTGGSVALFGAGGGTCTTPRQVNNCVSDSNQKQGFALGGGPSCTLASGARVLIVGAPGYSSNAGRIDVYAEGTNWSMARDCGAPTPTPTPTPTPQATATPAPRVSPITGEVIPVDPKTGGLPAPRVIQENKSLALVAPLLSSKNKLFLFIGYEFRVEQTSVGQAFGALTLEGFKIKASQAGGTKRRTIFSRRNRVTLRNLGSGTYIATYRPVFVRAKGSKQRVFGKRSATAQFLVK